MKSKTDEVALLKKQLADTQKLLKREALEIMINVAEKELKIPIRKKPGRGGGPPNQ